MALKFLSKALRRVQELISLRKEANPDYAVLEAPLFYLQGNYLVTYVEEKADVFGNIPQLQFEDSSEEEEEEEEGNSQEEEAPEEEG